MSRYLNVISWNARGIRNKKDELFNFLISRNIDICLISETMLNNNISIKHPEFYCYRKDRDGGRGGGVAVLVKKTVEHTFIPPLNTFLIENIGVKVRTSNGNYINIFSCYFPGGSPGRDNTKKLMFKSDLRKIYSGNDNYIFGGDFNCRHSLWGCQRSNCWGNLLYEKLDSENFQILYPSDHTYIPSDPRRQSSTLDFFLTDLASNLTPVNVINDLGSDHLPIQITINSEFTCIQKSCYDFKKANWIKYSKYIKRHLTIPDENLENDAEHVDSMITTLSNTIYDAVNHSVPRRVFAVSSQPLPMYIKQLIKTRNVYRRNWKRYRDVQDLIETKICNLRISEEIRKFKNYAWNKKLSTLEKGAPPFWNVSKILKKKTTNIPILKYNNATYNTQLEKCEILAQTFSLNHTYSENLSDPSTITVVNNAVSNLYISDNIPHTDICISINKISDIMKNLKLRKSPGTDRLTNQCLKALPKKGLKYLTIIINSCLKLNYFPKIWKHSKIIPIRKPNKPPDCPISYRPISLLSSLSKILEKIIKEKLIDFIDAESILPSQQFGFRKEHNTVQPLVRIRNLVTSNFNIGKSTGMILMDIKAAFDSVWHNGLIYKMIVLNFPLKLIKIIHSYLSERFFNVYIGSISSSRREIKAGCPQGSCLSPILYNIYTSDFPTLQGCVTSIFADDTALLSSGILATEVITNLETALIEVHKYFSKWNILVNPQKTQAIYFSRRRKQCFLPQQPITFNNTLITWDDKVKYLGVVLDPKLKFKDHIPYIIDKVNKVIRLLYPLINRNSKLSVGNKSLILKSVFHAIMFYAAPVWSNAAQCHKNKLQIAQNKLLKMIYNLPWHYPTLRLHSLAHVELINNKIQRLTLNFNTRCLNSEFEHINELGST